MKTLKWKVLSIVASALFVLGMATASTASALVIIYHPKAPKCLNR